jgi:hypothetical protein
MLWICEKGSTGSERRIDPCRVGQDGWVNGLDESDWFVREEVAVWVELGFYIRI